jgi:predicted Zn-dependent protease
MRVPGPRQFLAIGLLVLLAGCSSVLGPGVQVTQTNGQMAPLVSDTGAPEDDLIGARENPKIIASYGGIYSDRPAEIMLAQIVGKLLAAADQPNSKFTVTILDSPIVNAFALPGGYVYITRGLLTLANNEAEIAGVLGH